MAEVKSVSQYFLFGINLVTFFCGLILIFIGAFLHTQYASYFQFLDTSFLNVSVLCIVMGVFVAIISFLGLYGAIRHDYCALLTFSTCLGFIIAFELALGVAAFALAQQNRLTTSIGGRMEETLQLYNQTGQEGVTRVWDILQTDFQCCGVEFPGQWAMSPWGRRARRSQLPDSCCSGLPFNQFCTASSAQSYTEGCLDALRASAKKNAGILGAVACAVAFGQILLVVAACNMLKSLRKPDSCRPCF